MGISTETLLDKQPETVFEMHEEPMVTSENPNVPNDGTDQSDIDVDLQDTGILPNIDKESAQQENTDLHPENTMQDATLSQINEEHLETEKIDQFEDCMDTVTNNEVGADVLDDKENKVNVDANLNETGQKQTKDQHSRKLIVLLDMYSNVDVDIQKDETKKTMQQTEYTETEEDSEDASGNDSGIETDGWEPDDVKKKKDRRAKKQTKTIATEDGSLSVCTVGRPKRIPHKRQHKCHLCNETFEMQCNFTKHYATKNLDQPFQCEVCRAILQTPNGLFKHQLSHA